MLLLPPSPPLQGVPHLQLPWQVLPPLTHMFTRTATRAFQVLFHVHFESTFVRSYTRALLDSYVSIPWNSNAASARQHVPSPVPASTAAAATSPGFAAVPQQTQRSGPMAPREENVLGWIQPAAYPQQPLPALTPHVGGCECFAFVLHCLRSRVEVPKGSWFFARCSS